MDISTISPTIIGVMLCSPTLSWGHHLVRSASPTPAEPVAPWASPTVRFQRDHGHARFQRQQIGAVVAAASRLAAVSFLRLSKL